MHAGSTFRGLSLPANDILNFNHEIPAFPAKSGRMMCEGFMIFLPGYKVSVKHNHLPVMPNLIGHLKTNVIHLLIAVQPNASPR